MALAPDETTPARMTMSKAKDSITEMVFCQPGKKLYPNNDPKAVHVAAVGVEILEFTFAVLWLIFEHFRRSPPASPHAHPLHLADVHSAVVDVKSI